MDPNSEDQSGSEDDEKGNPLIRTDAHTASPPTQPPSDHESPPASPHSEDQSGSQDSQDADPPADPAPETDHEDASQIDSQSSQTGGQCVRRFSR